MNYKCPKCNCVFESELSECPCCKVKFTYSREESGKEKYQCPKCSCVFLGALSSCPACRVKFIYSNVDSENKPNADANKVVEPKQAPVAEVVAEQPALEVKEEVKNEQVSEPVVEVPAEEVKNDETPMTKKEKKALDKKIKKQIKEEKERNYKKGGFRKFLDFIGWLIFVAIVLGLILVAYVIFARMGVIPESITNPIDGVLGLIPGFEKTGEARKFIVNTYNDAFDGISFIVESVKEFYSNLFK